MNSGTSSEGSEESSDLRHQLEARVEECNHLLAKFASQFTAWYRKDHETSFKSQCPDGVPNGLWEGLESQLVKDGSLVEFYSISRAHFFGRLAHYFRTRDHPDFHKARYGEVAQDAKVDSGKGKSRDGVKERFEADKAEIKKLSDQWNSEYSDQEFLDGKLSDRVRKEFQRLKKRRNPSWFNELQVLRGASIESTIVGLWLPLGLWLYSSGDACMILADCLCGSEMASSLMVTPEAEAILGNVSKRLRKPSRFENIEPHHIDSAVNRAKLFRLKTDFWTYDPKCA